MSSALMAQAEDVFVKTYTRFPIVITKGKGCTLWDENGKAYTDFVAGIAVCNLGHAHPGVASALTTQAQRLLHVSNLYYTLPQIELANRLVELSFADRVFFCNSGAEANEAAIKIARKYASQKKGVGKRIISMEQSFHGRTMGALSATGQDKIKKGFDPLLGGFDFVPFNDIKALEKAVDASTCAVILEPIQGEGGVVTPSGDYLKQVRQLCDDTGTLLIFDEIQTGMGRCGKLFAHQLYNVTPDIMTLAKALANGLPIGAMLVTQKVADAFGPGSHASTFGGTPIVTAAALTVLKTLTGEGIIAHGANMGEFFLGRLKWLKHRHTALITEVRGRGLLLGLKLNSKGAPFVDACMKKGFLINCIQDNILRFIPPLMITKEEIEALVVCLDEIMDQHGNGIF